MKRRAAAVGVAVVVLGLGSVLLPAQADPGPHAVGDTPLENAVGAPAGWGAATALRPDTRARVLAEAERALARPPRPVITLASAGSEDPTDPRVIATRAAFEDADDTLILAMAWKETGEPRYRDAALARLVAWARTNVPTGHPIDETRLDALVHAYALTNSVLTPEDAAAVRGWFTTMRDRKRSWRFGPNTTDNNHRTHQLKMLVLLDRAVEDDTALAADRAAAEAHVARNLDATTGESVDLVERKALYYHAYDLDAWLEIVLVTGCCVQPVTTAYQLLERRLLSGDIGGEFAGSAAPLDQIRADAGFGYGGAGSTFDLRRAEHAILTFYTLRSQPIPSQLAADLTVVRVDRRTLYTLARYESWKR